MRGVIGLGYAGGVEKALAVMGQMTEVSFDHMNMAQVSSDHMVKWRDSGQGA